MKIWKSQTFPVNCLKIYLNFNETAQFEHAKNNTFFFKLSVCREALEQITTEEALLP